ncbi:MAG: hypothetical protein WBQ02_10445 [Terracidiphilus sp.]
MVRALRTALILNLGILGGIRAQAKVAADSKDALKTLNSIGDALNAPDRHPVHILYVHGIDQVGAGDSALLRDSICTRLNLCATSDWKSAGVEFADHGEFADGVQPPALQYLGNPVWNNAEEWHAAAPFVVHWVVRLRRHQAVLVLDEVNWWPIVLALKCRRIVATETYLAGPDRSLLQVCSQDSAQDPGGVGRLFPWITPDEAQKLAAVRPRGVLVNRTLKGNLIDWGLADVLISTGPLNGILRDGIRQLMAKSAAFDTNFSPNANSGDALVHYNWRAQLEHNNTLDQEFIGVTHSLGGYLLFNTLNPETADSDGPVQSPAETVRIAAENSDMQYIFGRMSLIYLFANQLQMLEITNLETAPASPAAAMSSRGLEPPPPPPTNPAANFRSLVNRWQQLQSDFQASLHPNEESAREKIQVVAWSDPSDVLTWRVPRIGNVDVVNLYVQNAPHWFWLFESPTSAHGNYAENKSVLHVMFDDTKTAATH